MVVKVSRLETFQTFLFGAERVTRWKASAFCEELSRFERSKQKISEMTSILKDKENEYNTLLKGLTGSQKKETKETLSSLKYRWTALKARSGEKGEGSIDLREELENWKKQQPLFSQKEKQINRFDNEQLEELKKYKEFASLLKKDEALRGHFFKWAIRDAAPVDVFIEYPDVAFRLKSCYIAARVGRLAEKTLRIEEKNGEKDLKLRFEDKNWFTVLDEKKEVTFKNGVSVSMKKIFETLASKNHKAGFVEFFEKGIENFDTRRFGSYEPSPKFLGVFGKGFKFKEKDLQRDDWYKNLPVIETLTKDQLESRLNRKLEENCPGVYMVRSTTEADCLDIQKTHAFLEVAIKDKSGHFKLYSFGKSPRNFPLTSLGGLWFLTNTVTGEVEYNDTNDFFSQRKHGIHPIVCTEDEIKMLMSRMKTEIEKARRGNLVFQLCWKNCAHWVDETGKFVFEERYTEKFKTRFSDLAPTNPFLKSVIEKIDGLSKRGRIFWLMISFFLFTWRVKCIHEGGCLKLDGVAGTPFAYTDKNNDIFNYCPGRVCHDIEKGEIEGVVFSGNGSLKAMTLG
jgi:hypothetical protein